MPFLIQDTQEAFPCHFLIFWRSEPNLIKGISEVSYADGRKGVVYLFSIKIELNGIEKEIKAALIPNPYIKEAIAGVELFTPFVVLLDFKNKRIVLKKEEELQELSR